MFDAVKRRYSDVSFQQLNVDDNSNASLSSQYNVTGIPRLVFLDAGGNVLYNGGAPRDEDSLNNLISQYH